MTGLAEHYLKLVCDSSPVVKRAIDNFSDTSIPDYLSQVLVTSDSPLQSRNDLWEVVYRYVESLLGTELAELTVLELEALPAILSANHHGVDFLAQSVTGSLVFSLRSVAGKPAKTIPVFACGNIPLDNPTYPQGMLFYDAPNTAEAFKQPMKLPIFPKRCKKELVSIARAFDAEMLDRAEQRLGNMIWNKKINPVLGKTAQRILEEDYRDQTVMGLDKYSQQAVILNNRIWNRCFNEPGRAPQLIYMEVEQIASRLLQADLRNEDSLVWQVMFDPDLRTLVLNQLDGVKGCWELRTLSERVHRHRVGNEAKPGGCGTVFFWAVNTTGSRIPIFLTETYGGAELCGRDERGQIWTRPFTSENVLQGLLTKQLLPSLFTCCVAIAYMRGISFCGGYFQAQYLPLIQKGMVNALRSLKGCDGVADRISLVPSDVYVSGMQLMLRDLQNDYLLPVGPIEIAARGGLSFEQLVRLRSITVGDAHLAGLTETFPDMPISKTPSANWYMQLAADHGRKLRQRIIVI